MANRSLLIASLVVGAAAVGPAALGADEPATGTPPTPAPESPPVPEEHEVSEEDGPTPPVLPPTPTRVAFVLDASGSMNRSLGKDSISRIAAARIAVREAILALSGHPDFSLEVHVYGPSGCAPPDTLPETIRGEASATLRRLAAVGAHGPSSLAAAVVAAEEQLLQWSGRRVMVILADGFDRCGADLGTLSLHPDIDRHVLGLAVNAETAGKLLALGEYTEIRSPADLTVALSRITGDLLNAPPLPAATDHSTSR